jgi:hypothetical protein
MKKVCQHTKLLTIDTRVQEAKVSRVKTFLFF